MEKFGKFTKDQVNIYLPILHKLAKLRNSELKRMNNALFQLLGRIEKCISEKRHDTIYKAFGIDMVEVCTIENENSIEGLTLLKLNEETVQDEGTVNLL